MTGYPTPIVIWTKQGKRGLNSELDRIQPGSIVGPYRIVRGFKGRGGMARVVEVEVREKYRQPNLPRRLALKVAKEEFQDALVAESDFLRRFDHPNVVRIFPLAGYHRPVYAARERFSFGWGWYYTMELLSGKPLEHHLTSTTANLLRSRARKRRRLSLLKALGIARQLTAALEHIHERYVINLDIKPSNVLLRQRRLNLLRGSVPQVVLCDFGISRDLRYPRAGLLGVATPEYVSPEQTSEFGRHHQRLDGRSDIFSLGILLYEMLTGTLPFDTIALVADPTYTPTPPRQIRRSIPPLLEEIVMRALAKNALRRYQTAAEMQAALRRVQTPPDWEAAARRIFAGATVVGCIAVGGWGMRDYVMTGTPTPPPTPLPAVETPTHTPMPAPTTPALAMSPTATQPAPTSTQAPTRTPTRTRRPVTPTFTPTPGGH
jgi:serine/threonine protein kinase